MAWVVEYTDEFGEWWATLTEDEQAAISNHVGELERRGPLLPFPYSSGVEGSKHGHMRELRVQSGGKPLRIFYAFNPERAAILLIGGDKTGDDRFYERYVPIADKLYDVHLEELKKESTDER
ncbi:MAG: type II toxin-antitoxin system RelE/ParE family toxin [Proteobacteria bacterium]|nr:type II toxin-antitoxin system RelE/ParE family toxin [Pseudomonadota bacterium]MBI3498440.1 type II toxin-antitoxin system RelE/ParE family toxin [Pseudomonadota bacterium]